MKSLLRVFTDFFSANLAFFALYQYSGTIPEILRRDGTDHDTLADVVVDVRQAKPL